MRTSKIHPGTFNHILSEVLHYHVLAMVAVNDQPIGRNHMEFMDFFFCNFYE